MAQKTIPVILKHPGVSERIQYGGNGFIEKNTSAMTEKIVWLLTHNAQRSTIAEKTRKTIRKTRWGDTIKTFLKKYAQIYPVNEGKHNKMPQ